MEASRTSLPSPVMLAVTRFGSTLSGRSNSRLNSLQLVLPGVLSSWRAWTTSFRSTVLIVKSWGSYSGPTSRAMRNVLDPSRSVTDGPQSKTVCASDDGNDLPDVVADVSVGWEAVAAATELKERAVSLIRS